MVSQSLNLHTVSTGNVIGWFYMVVSDRQSKLMLKGNFYLLYIPEIDLHYLCRAMDCLLDAISKLSNCLWGTLCEEDPLENYYLSAVAARKSQQREVLSCLPNKALHLFLSSGRNDGWEVLL